MRKLTSALFATMLLTLGAVPAAHALTVSIVPRESEVIFGSTLTVDVVASDLGEGVAPSLGSYEAGVFFDPAMFSVVDLTFGTGLDLAGFGTDHGVFLDEPGVVDAYEVSFDSIADLNNLQPDAFTLFTVTFLAINAGPTGLILQMGPLANAEGDRIGVNTLNGELLFSVAPAPVPLPGAAWLLFSGLAGAGVFFRGRRGSARG